MAQASGLMAGKRGLIMGVANNRSIAWGIAKACADAGAEVALTWQGDALKKRVEPLAQELGAFMAGHCDVTDLETIDAVFAGLEKHWGKIDFVVHAIAFSDKDELTGRYLDTSRDNFNRTMDISVFSLAAVAKRAEPVMNDGGSIITLTYYGAEKVMPNYNVMGVAKAALEASVRYLAVDLGNRGIRVNAVSAGPIKTRRLPLHSEMERIQCAAEAHRFHRGSRQVGALPAVRPFDRRDRRNSPCRFRLPHHRHEGGGCA
jgi:enoyl-[acyl-carrier protein] reductase I